MSSSVHCLTLPHIIYIYVISLTGILRNKLFGAQIKIEASRRNCGCAEIMVMKTVWQETSVVGTALFYKQQIKPNGRLRDKVKIVPFRKQLQLSRIMFGFFPCDLLYNSQNICELQRLISYFKNNGIEHWRRKMTYSRLFSDPGA